MWWTLLFFESVYQKSEKITQPLKYIFNKELKETKSILQQLFVELIHALESKILLTFFLFLEKKIGLSKEIYALKVTRHFLQMKTAW